MTGRRLLPALVLALLGPGAALALCGRDSDAGGTRPRTDCPDSTGDLHFQFQESGLCTATEPFNDEPAPAPGFSIRCGGAIGADGNDPAPVWPALYGTAMRFDSSAPPAGAKFIDVTPEILTGGSVLDGSGAVAISAEFWIKPRSPLTAGAIVYKGDTVGTGCNGTACRNYEIRMEATGALTFRWNNPPNLHSCTTGAVNQLVPDEWQHVIFGIDQDGMGKAQFRYRYNGDTLITTSCGINGMAANQQFLSVASAHLFIGRGEPGDTASNFEIDELRIDVNQPLPDVNQGSVAITQVLFGHPSKHDRVTFYRPFAAGGGESFDRIFLSSGVLNDSGGIPSADGGPIDSYTLPASVEIGRGEFVQVVLCNAADASCPSPDPGVTAPCRSVYTLNGVGTLGDGALGPEASCDAANCLNPNDSLVFVRDGSQKLGVAWGAHSAADANFTGGLADYGVWPTIALGGRQAALPPTALGYKLKQQGNNSDTFDSWVAMASTSDAIICTPAGTTGVVEHLSAFELAGHVRAAEIHWETLDELDASGFRIYRSFSGPGGPFEVVGGELIPSRAALSGSSYDYRDEGLDPGTVVWYGLEMLDADGTVIDARPSEQVVVLDDEAPGCACSVGARKRGVAGAATLAAVVLGIGWARRKRSARHSAS